MTLTERVKAQLISYLGSIHSIRKILLICKHQQHSIPKLILPMKPTTSEDNNGAQSCKFAYVKTFSYTLNTKCKELQSWKYLIQHSVQLIPSFNNSVSIIAINNEDKSLCVLEIMSPQRSDLERQHKISMS